MTLRVPQEITERMCLVFLSEHNGKVEFDSDGNIIVSATGADGMVYKSRDSNTTLIEATVALDRYLQEVEA